MTTDIELSIHWEEDSALWDTVYLAGAPLPGLATVSGAHGRKLDVKSAPGRNGARIIDKGYEPAKIEITLRMWTPEHLDDWFGIAATLTYRREPPPTRRATGTSRSKAQAAAEARRVLVAASDELTVREAIAEELDRTGATTAEIESKTTAQLAQLAEQRRRRGTQSQRARRLERHDIEISHPALDTININRVYIDEVTIPQATSVKGVFEVKIKAIESRAPTTTRSRAVGSSSASASTAGQSFATGIRTAFDVPSPSSNGGSAP